MMKLPSDEQTPAELAAKDELLTEQRRAMSDYMKHLTAPSTREKMQPEYNTTLLTFNNYMNIWQMWREIGMGLKSDKDIENIRTELIEKLKEISDFDPDKGPNSPAITPTLEPILVAFNKVFEDEFKLDSGSVVSEPDPVSLLTRFKQEMEYVDWMFETNVHYDTEVPVGFNKDTYVEVGFIPKPYTDESPEHQVALRNYMTYELAKLDKSNEEYIRHAEYLTRESTYNHYKDDLENILEIFEQGLEGSREGPGIIDNGQQMMGKITNWVTSNEVKNNMMKMTTFDMNSLERMIIPTPEELLSENQRISRLTIDISKRIILLSAASRKDKLV